MDKTGEFPSPPEHTNIDPVPVVLESIKHSIDAKLLRGNVIGQGESFIVREATIFFDGEDNKVRTYPVAIKAFREQDAEFRGNRVSYPLDTEARNYSYEAQLIYYECLRRIGVKVIPTFRLAKDTNGNVLGIVMTNLNIMPLDTSSTVTRVDSSKTDSLGNTMSSLTRKRDITHCRKLGIRLDRDSWMFQYSTGWRNIGKIIPGAVVSDIVGLEVVDPQLLGTFLSREENQDLLDRAKSSPILLPYLYASSD